MTGSGGRVDTSLISQRVLGLGAIGAFRYISDNMNNCLNSFMIIDTRSDIGCTSIATAQALAQALVVVKRAHPMVPIRKS